MDKEYGTGTGSIFDQRHSSRDKRGPRHASNTNYRISATTLTATTVDDRGNSNGNFIETE